MKRNFGWTVRTTVLALALLMPRVETLAEDSETDGKPIELTDTFQPMLAKDGTLKGWSVMAKPTDKEHPGLQDASAIFTTRDDLIVTYAGAEPGSEQTVAALTFDQSFSEYVFEIDYCWLGARFKPRDNAPRDAGVLFHLYPDGPRKIWPACIECQIGESDLGGPFVSGDLWVVGEEHRVEMPQKDGKFAPLTEGSVLTKVGEKRNAKGLAGAAAREPGMEVWNTVRVIVKADQYAIFQINGQTVNEVYNIQRKVDEKWVPLTEGPISLQAEWAEMLYRNPRIRKILPTDAKPSSEAVKPEE